MFWWRSGDGKQSRRRGSAEPAIKRAFNGSIGFCGEVTQTASLQRGAIDVDPGRLSLVAIVLSMVYGACMGTFALFSTRSASAMQVLASMIKVPALFFLTLLVTLPSLYVFNGKIGNPLSTSWLGLTRWSSKRRQTSASRLFMSSSRRPFGGSGLACGRFGHARWASPHSRNPVRVSIDIRLASGDDVDKESESGARKDFERFGFTLNLADADPGNPGSISNTWLN